MINTLTNLLTLNMYVVYVRWKTCIISFTLSKILMCISIHLPIVSTYCIYLLCLPIVSIYCIYLLYLSIVSIHPSICQTEVFSHAHVLLGIFLPLRWLAGVGIADCTGPAAEVVSWTQTYIWDTSRAWWNMIEIIYVIFMLTLKRKWQIVVSWIRLGG